MKFLAYATMISIIEINNFFFFLFFTEEKAPEPEKKEEVVAEKKEVDVPAAEEIKVES